jgi:hypothetical protein
LFRETIVWTGFDQERKEESTKRNADTDRWDHSKT